MNVLILINSFDGVAYHRIAAPYLKMARTGEIDALFVEMNTIKMIDEEEGKKFPAYILSDGFYFDKESNKYVSSGHSIDSFWYIPDETLKSIDVCVFSRNISPTLKPEHVFKRLRDFGIKVICDMDDSYTVGSKHVLASFYRKSNVDKCIFANMLYADAITCTTPILKEELNKAIGVPKKITLAKNAIDLTDPQWENYDGKYEEGLFGWMGSVTHVDDLKMMQKGYEKSCKPKLSLGGVVKGDTKWQEVIDVFGSDVEYCEPKKIQNYAELLYPYHVVLAPLLDNKFNRSKSELKMLEAAALRKPIIVSDVYPYKFLAENNVNCIVAKNNAEGWAKAINFAANNYGFCEEMAENLVKDVNLRYNLDAQNEKRLKLINSL